MNNVHNYAPMFITEFGNNHPEAVRPCRYTRAHKSMTANKSTSTGTMFLPRGLSGKYLQSGLPNQDLSPGSPRPGSSGLYPSALRLCENRISFARFAKSTAAIARCGRGYATIRKVLRESQNPGLSLQPTPSAL